jgi:hypothetical protein
MKDPIDMFPIEGISKEILKPLAATQSVDYDKNASKQQ